jgi:hypothetical protein
MDGTDGRVKAGQDSPLAEASAAWERVVGAWSLATLMVLMAVSVDPAQEVGAPVAPEAVVEVPADPAPPSASPSRIARTPHRSLVAEFGIEGVAASDVVHGPIPVALLLDDLLAHVSDEDWSIDPGVRHHFGDRRTELAPGEGFVERAETRESRVGECRLVHRRIVDVEVGIEGDAGLRIASGLRQASDPDAFFGHEGSRDVYGDPLELLERDCDDAAAVDIVDFYHVDEVAPIACGLPDRDLRCFSVTRFAMASRGSESFVGRVLVFDRGTGELLQRADLYPGLTEAEGDRLVELAYLDYLSTRVTFGENPTVVGSIVPTREGLAYVEMHWPSQTPMMLRFMRIVLSWDLVARAAEHRTSLGPGRRIDPTWLAEATT